MRKLIIIFLVSFFGLFLSCNNDDNSNAIEFKSTGEILGEDIALCPCCGGWLIKIDNDTNSYRFNTLPQNSSINLRNTPFPISVKFNWTLDQSFSCTVPRRIIIEQIDLN